MGAGQSGGFEIGGSSMGYQVLRVYPNSPGSQAGLKAYFDFIVAIGNTRFNKEDGSLREILKASVDQKLKMIVFNTRNKQAREVEIVPTTSWGGSGLLGVSIKHSSFDKADERVWHVVQVDQGSPAHQAGLRAEEDYVIGSDSILQESDDLYNLIEAHEGKALKLFVYNSKSDNCREVICHPNSRWGGRGFLGCEFGHGLLHRIPYADNQAVGGDPKPTSQQQQPSFTGLVRQPTMPSQQQMPSQQVPMQPGSQMFQQALFNSNLTSQSPQPFSQQQQSGPTNQQPSTVLSPPPRPMNNTQPTHTLSQPPDVPQTFAQLVNAQLQASQEQQKQHYQQQQQQQQQQQPLYHHQAPSPQVPIQPGNQMFQQAIFNSTITSPPPQPLSQQQQQPPNSTNQHPSTMLPPPPGPATNIQPTHVFSQPPEVPQTFAQLANAQMQASQEQQQQLHHHHHQQQQLQP